MAQTTVVRLTGEDLTTADVWEVAVEGVAAELDDSARQKMAAAREVVDRAVAAEGPTYGVTTGFGRFVSERVPEELAEELQLRLLRSHACGVGEPYPDEIVRAALLMRANTLAKGYSGTRPEVAERLLDCLEHGVLPEVPSRGSVGASGDLAPLAHLALPLVGEGRARVGGELLSGADALARAGLEPLRLQAKEGLSLVNGTQFMGAFAALGLVRARRLAQGRRRRLRALGRGAPGLTRQLPARNPRAQAAARAKPPPRQTSWRSSRARRSSRPTAGAIASRTRTRCGALLRCTAPRATSSTTSTTPPASS